MINRGRLVQTFCDLVQIDSPSGEEEALADDLLRRLGDLGLDAIKDDYGNVIADDGKSASLLLSAHMDTVEPGRGVKPIVKEDRIVSDGSTILGGDCKAGLAAILEGLESLKEDGTISLPVQVAFSRNEEIGLEGARNLDYSKINAKQAVVFDGEGPVSRITSASPTYVGFDIEITGRAAHAGVEPEKGVSAIHVAADIISRLPQGRLDEETTFNVGVIKGGSVRNAVPEITSVTGEFRSRSLETLDGIRIQLSSAIDEARRMFPEAVVEHHLHTQFETYTLTEEDPAIKRVMAALKTLGLEPDLQPSGGGTDGNVFKQHGISTVVVGMADHNMHTVREYVTISDLVDAAHFCETLLRA